MTTHSSSDALGELMRAAQAGDAAAYLELLRAITPRVREVVRRNRGFAGPAEVEDLVQDVLLSLHSVRATYDPSRPFAPWLFAIVRNRLADGARRFARTSGREVAFDDVTFPEPETNETIEDEGERAALRELPDAQRRAIELVKFEERSLEEAAALCGSSVGALKVATHRALATLSPNARHETRMNTNDLIDRLTTDLAPAPPLRNPWRRAGIWLLGALAYVAALTLAMLDPAPGAGSRGAALLAPQLAALMTAVLAAAAAFASVVPGYSRKLLAWPVVALGLWVGTLVVGASAAAPGGAPHREWLCVAQIVLGGAPLLAVLAMMLRRGAPLDAGVTAALAALAVGALTNVGACYSHPHTDNLLTLTWHGGAIAAMALLALLTGRFVFRWNAVRAPMRSGH